MPWEEKAYPEIFACKKHAVCYRVFLVASSLSCPVNYHVLEETAQKCLQGATQLPWSTNSVSLARASVMSMQSGSSLALPSLNLMTTGLPLSATTSTSILEATSSLQQVYTACDQESAHGFTAEQSSGTCFLWVITAKSVCVQWFKWL